MHCVGLAHRQDIQLRLTDADRLIRALAAPVEGRIVIRRNLQHLIMGAAGCMRRLQERERELQMREEQVWGLQEREQELQMREEQAQLREQRLKLSREEQSREGERQEKVQRKEVQGREGQHPPADGQRRSEGRGDGQQEEGPQRKRARCEGVRLAFYPI